MMELTRKPDLPRNRLVSVAGWSAFVLATFLLGLYAKAPTIPGVRPGRMAPRLRAPAADPRVLLYEFGVGSVTWFGAVIALPFMVWGARRIDLER